MSFADQSSSEAAQTTSNKATARVFLSYSRSDEDFARDLRARLLRHVSIWQDRTHLSSGKWWDQISSALTSGKVQHLVLIASDASLASRVVKDEWHLARQNGIQVHLVFGSAKPNFTLLPEWMRAQHFYDMAVQEQFNVLAAALLGPSHQNRVPFMGPEPDYLFVKRQGLSTEILHQINPTNKESPEAKILILKGPGGVGKTELTYEVCQSGAVRDFFYDGILFTTLGQSPRVSALQGDLLEALTGRRPTIQDVDMLRKDLLAAIGNRRMLLIIDDAWRLDHVRSFLPTQESKTLDRDTYKSAGDTCDNLKIIVTTRLSEIYLPTATRLEVSNMEKEEAYTLLSFGLSSDSLNLATQTALRGLSERAGRWPLLLAILNRAINEHVREYEMNAEAAILAVAEELDRRGLRAFDDQGDQRTRAVSACITLSTQLLSLEELELLKMLSLFDEDELIPFGIISRLWFAPTIDSPTSDETLRVLRKLFRLGLLNRLNLKDGIVQLHDILREYLIELIGRTGIIEVANKFLNNFSAISGVDLETDRERRFFFARLVSILRKANELALARDLLFDFSWVDMVARQSGVGPLVADYESFIDEADLQEVGAAVREGSRGNSAPVDTVTIASMIASRVAEGDQKPINTLRANAIAALPRYSVIFSDGSLSRVNSFSPRAVEHDASISALACIDQRLVASGGYDSFLRFWTYNKELKFESRRAGQFVKAIGALGEKVAVGWSDGTLEIWECSERPRVLLVKKFGVSIGCVTWHNKLCFAGTVDGFLHKLDIDTSTVRTVLAHSGAVSALCSSPGSDMVSGGADGVLRRWSAEHFDVANQGLQTREKIRCVTYRADGIVAFCGEGGSIGLVGRDGSIQPMDPLDATLIGLRSLSSVAMLAVTFELGLFVYVSNNGSIQPSFRVWPEFRDSFSAIDFDGDSTIWVGTETGRLIRGAVKM